MNQGWVYRDRVPAAAVGQSLLDYYCQRYRHSTREKWRDRIQQGQITLAGQSVPPDYPLQAGQHLAYHRRPWQEPTVPLDFKVLYEDDDLLAIAKPSGLPVLPGGQFLEHTLLHQLQRQYSENPPSPVHRLGRGTSGVMLLARSPIAKADLSRQLRHSSHAHSPQCQFVKTYRALIGSHDLPDTFEITDPIGPVPYPPLGTVHAVNPHGKPAFSQVTVLEWGDQQSIVEVNIKTGRLHQIRIHLAAAGYPLLGDPLYTVGGLPRYDKNSASHPVPSDLGYCLHACQLQFTHPVTRSPMKVTCLPPPSLEPTRDRSAQRESASSNTGSF